MDLAHTVDAPGPSSSSCLRTPQGSFGSGDPEHPLLPPKWLLKASPTAPLAFGVPRSAFGPLRSPRSPLGLLVCTSGPLGVPPSTFGAPRVAFGLPPRLLACTLGPFGVPCVSRGGPFRGDLVVFIGSWGPVAAPMTYRNPTTKFEEQWCPNRLLGQVRPDMSCLGRHPNSPDQSSPACTMLCLALQCDGGGGWTRPAVRRRRIQPARRRWGMDGAAGGGEEAEHEEEKEAVRTGPAWHDTSGMARNGTSGPD